MAQCIPAQIWSEPQQSERGGMSVWRTAHRAIQALGGGSPSVAGTRGEWLRRLEWQGKGKPGSFADPFAVGQQRSAHFLCRQRATVQPEAMPILACGKPMIEDPRQV